MQFIIVLTTFTATLASAAAVTPQKTQFRAVLRRQAGICPGIDAPQCCQLGVDGVASLSCSSREPPFPPSVNRTESPSHFHRDGGNHKKLVETNLEVAGDVADLASLEAACAESGLSAQCCTLVVVSCDPSLVSTHSIGGVRVWINIAFLVHPTPPHSYPVSASIVATFPWLADVCPPVHAGAHEDSRVGRFTGVGPPKDAVGHVNEQANMFFFFVLQGTDALLCSDV